MSNKTDKQLSNWTKGISEMYDRMDEKDNLLSSNRDVVKFIQSYATSILERATIVRTASDMFHEGLIDKETAQSVMSTQKREIKRQIEFVLESYLGGDK